MKMIILSYRAFINRNLVGNFYYRIGKIDIFMRKSSKFEKYSQLYLGLVKLEKDKRNCFSDDLLLNKKNKYISNNLCIIFLIKV